MNKSQDQEKAPELQIPNILWDLVAQTEPSGISAEDDAMCSKKIGDILGQGYEPFAVVPFMTRGSHLSAQPIMRNKIYFKRPSIVKEFQDESQKVMTV